MPVPKTIILMLILMLMLMLIAQVGTKLRSKCHVRQVFLISLALKLILADDENLKSFYNQGFCKLFDSIH